MLSMCSDKTGTLTENVMVFKEVVVTIFNQNHNNDKSVHLDDENTDQACLGGGEYSEAELQYRRPLPMCSFSDLAGRYLSHK